MRKSSTDSDLPEHRAETDEHSGSFEDESDARQAVQQLASDQLELYRRQPKELISHANREAAAIEGYRGRQLLELLQNADDAGEATSSARLFVVIRDDCLVVANSGATFSLSGLESLVISDCSPKQLDRNRFIGCKGLGFRSVLTWSDSPVISSGYLSVGFDRGRALTAIDELRNDSTAIQRALTAFQAAEGRFPVPVMRFPFVPRSEDLVLAQEYRARGFDTVVVLQFPTEDRRNRPVADALQQLDNFRTESLLFCRSLTEVELNGSRPRRWEILREVLDPTRTRLIIESPEGDALWTIHRREGQIETTEGGRLARPLDFETTVAVPDNPVPSPDRCLCVFFPTQDTLPLPVVLHATLELSDDRNRVHNTDNNRSVLAELARHLGDVIAAEASPSHPKRSLRMLEGIDRSDPELRRLGFVECAVSELRDRAIFPRIDGTLGTASGSYRTPHDSWHSLLQPDEFCDVLDVRSTERLTGVLELFEIGWFEHEVLVRRLKSQLERMDPELAGEVVGRLLSSDRLGKFTLGSFILTSAGQFLEPTAQCFFAPSSEAFPVPGWARDIQFVHPSFQRGLQTTAGFSTLRALSGQLEARGANVDEYRLDTVVRALASRARRADGHEGVFRTSELLQWLFRTTKGEPGVLSGITVPILDAAGHACSPDDCYLGPDYPGGELLYRLYSGIDGVRFVAPRDGLGLQEASPESGERFLVGLGVHDRPKNVPLNRSQSRKLARQALEQHEYPSLVRGEECDNFEAALEVCQDFDVVDAELPERFFQLLGQPDAAALVGFLLGGGQALIASDTDQAGCFVARKSREQKLWEDRSIRVPNPVLLALRSERWVPTRDGAKCTPGKVILSGAGSRLLRGLYYQHAIDVEDAAIRRNGGRRAVNGLLTRLGAISSLEAIDTESLYELLARLPSDDPEGEHAPGIYRTLIEAGVTSEESPAKRQFLKNGLVWARYRGELKYLSVNEVRYNANVTVPSLIERHIKVAELPRRKSTKLVRDVLGVEPLAPRDIVIRLIDERTEYDPTSEDANAAFRRALPYVYAIRLGKKLDDDNRERNLLAQAELRLCSCIQAEATLPSGDVETIELKTQGDRLLLDRRLYIVDHFDREAASLVRFWQGVANLVAELLGADVAAEAANVFRCRTPSEMEDVVRGLVDAEADEKLAEARVRFHSDVEDEPQDLRPAPEPSEPESDAQEHADEVAERADESNSELDGDMIEGTFDFVPVDAPARTTGARRKIVVTRGARGAHSATRSLLATEDVAFRVVEEYESSQGRFPFRVSHLLGAEGFGCDLISFDSASELARARDDGLVSESSVSRYIEVKGRSSRTGDVELTANELRKAESEPARYYLYRVFRDPGDAARFELAILHDPVHSDAVRQVTRFDLSEGSGAVWYEMVAIDEAS